MLNVEMVKLRKYFRKNRTGCVAMMVMEARWDAFHHSTIPRSGAWPLPPPHRHTHTIASHHLKISVSHSIPRRPLRASSSQYNTYTNTYSTHGAGTQEEGIRNVSIFTVASFIVHCKCLNANVVSVCNTS